MKKRTRFNRRKFISRITGLVLLVVLAVMSYLSLSGTLTADALEDKVTEYYQIQKGDTLWEIAKRYQAPNEDIRAVIYEIRQLNALESTDIYPGQVLIVPKAVSYDL